MLNLNEFLQIRINVFTVLVVLGVFSVFVEYETNSQRSVTPVDVF